MKDIRKEDLITEELNSKNQEGFYSRMGVIGQYFMDYVESRNYITLTNHANGTLMLKKDIKTVIEGLTNFLEEPFTDEDIVEHNEKVLKAHHEYLYGEESSKRIRKNLKYENVDVGFVYFIKEEFSGTVKIGKTKNIENREKQFNVKLPFKWEFIKVINSNNHSITERLLHKKYKDKRVNGEWFQLTNEDIEEITSENFGEEILDSINGSRDQVE